MTQRHIYLLAYSFLLLALGCKQPEPEHLRIRIDDVTDSEDVKFLNHTAKIIIESAFGHEVELVSTTEQKQEAPIDIAFRDVTSSPASKLVSLGKAIGGYNIDKMVDPTLEERAQDVTEFLGKFFIPQEKYVRVLDQKREQNCLPYDCSIMFLHGERPILGRWLTGEDKKRSVRQTVTKLLEAKEALAGQGN